MFKGIPKLEPRYPVEVGDVAGDQLETMLQCSSRDDRVTQAHFPLLPQCHGVVSNRMGRLQVKSCSKECLEVRFVGGREPVIAEDLNFGGDRHSARQGLQPAGLHHVRLDSGGSAGVATRPQGRQGPDNAD